MQNHNNSKRKQIAIRFFTYGVMTVATVVISLVCLLLVLGYRFDAGSGTLEQGGLLQFRSFPTNATIELDGKPLNFQTPGKYNAETGPHSVSMKLEGYQDWSKTFSVKAGEVRWLNYARFVPRSITTSGVASLKSVSDSLPSPDRRWIAVIEDASKATIRLFDIRNPEQLKNTAITIDKDVFRTEPGKLDHFSIEQWDIGGRYLLIKHRSGDILEYIRVDRTTEQPPLNITRRFKLPISDLQFVGSSGSIFYGLTERDIRRFNVAQEAVSSPVITNALSFELYKEDTISFVARRDDKQIVGIYQDDKEMVLGTYDDKEPVLVDSSSFFNRDYVAIAHEGKVELLQDPLENTDAAGQTLAKFSRGSDIKWLQFNSSGRFIVAGDGTQFSTYDIETGEIFKGAFAGTRRLPDQPLQWLDDYYLVSDADGKLRIGEFDGTNQHEIATVVPGYFVTLSENGRYLFSIGSSPSGFQLQTSQMVTSD